MLLVAGLPLVGAAMCPTRVKAATFDVFLEGFTDGPFVILTAFDHLGGRSLVDGRMFTITSNMPALSIDRIYFWNEGEVGYQYPNLYPNAVQLTDFTSSSVTFSTGPTPIDIAPRGLVKSLYR